MNFSLADYKNIILLTLKVTRDHAIDMSERPTTSAVTARRRATTPHHLRDDREGTALLATVLLGASLSLLATPLLVGVLVVVPLLVLVSVVTER